MNSNTHPADGDDRTATGSRPEQTGPARPAYEPLPYGTGFTAPEPLGFGVSPEPATPSVRVVDSVEHRRFGSPVLAAAGVASLAVAVWAILGAPVITPTVLLAGGLVLTVLIGLIMVIRR